MWRYTTRRVLVTEWVDGKSPSQLLAAADKPLPLDGASAASSAAEDERQRQARRQVLSLVRMGVQCSLAQLLVTGVMHGDPHSGNLLLRNVRCCCCYCGGARCLPPGACSGHRCPFQTQPHAPPPAPSRPTRPSPCRTTAASATSTLGWWCASRRSTARP
jgi:hypothetical protein